MKFKRLKDHDKYQKDIAELQWKKNIYLNY